jgi:hypothetical protein
MSPRDGAAYHAVSGGKAIATVVVAVAAWYVCRNAERPGRRRRAGGHDAGIEAWAGEDNGLASHPRRSRRAVPIVFSNRFDLGWIPPVFILGSLAYAVIAGFFRQFPDVQTVVTLVVVSAVGGAYIYKWLSRDSQ